MTRILTQLAHTTLLPDSISATIAAGDTATMPDVIYHLVIGCMDAEAMIAIDPETTWNERRISRQLLAVTFLMALVLEHASSPVESDAAVEEEALKEVRM